MSWVLDGGPYFIAHRPLLLQKWQLVLVVEKLSLQKSPLWVKLWKVPLELFTVDGLSHNASATGVLLYMDKAIEQRRRVHFARVCIEVGYGDELHDAITVDIKKVGQVEVLVEYSWKHAMCSLCYVFGHEDQTCTGLKQVWRLKKVQKSSNSASC